MDALVGGTYIKSMSIDRINRMEVSNEFQDLTDKSIVTSTKQVMFTFDFDLI